MSRRDDQQLAILLDESAEWTAKGSNGVILGRAESLREAIDALVAFGHSLHVVSLTRTPAEDIVVFSPQMDRLIEAHGRSAPKPRPGIPKGRAYLVKPPEKRG